MKFLKILVLIGIFLSPIITNANDINFSGFATFAGGSTTNNNETLDGYDDTFAFDTGSLVALQASSDLGNDWGVTIQLLARGSEEWNLNAEWAYLSYDVNDEWRLLFGRQRAPFYMYSDYLDVSYAYHWIKPPSGVYSLPFDVFDGIGSIYTVALGDFDTTFHLVYGRNNDKSPLLGEDRNTDFSDFFSGSITLNRDWLTLRASYARADLLIPINELSSLFDGWRATGTFASIGDQLEIKGDAGDFASVGFIIDYEDYLFVGEYTEVDPGNNLFPKQNSYYLSFGYRIDTILLHFTYGADKDKANFNILNNVPAGVDPGLDFLLTSTNGLLLSTEQDSSFWTLGVRWEVADSMALKMEFTDFKDDRPLATEASLFQLALTTVF